MVLMTNVVINAVSKFNLLMFVSPIAVFNSKVNILTLFSLRRNPEFFLNGDFAFRIDSY